MTEVLYYRAVKIKNSYQDSLFMNKPAKNCPGFTEFGSMVIRSYIDAFVKSQDPPPDAETLRKAN